jgi:hypothetical protein
LRQRLAVGVVPFPCLPSRLAPALPCKKAPAPQAVAHLTPSNAAPPRQFVDEEETALWASKAETGQLPGGFTRPAAWETAGNAEALRGIGPEDPYGVTKDVQAG